MNLELLKKFLLLLKTKSNHTMSMYLATVRRRKRTVDSKKSSNNPDLVPSTKAKRQGKMGEKAEWGKKRGEGWRETRSSVNIS